MALSNDLYSFMSGHNGEGPPTKRLALLGGCLVIVAYAIQAWIKHIRFRQQYRFPNEVPGLPIVGNSLQMPLSAQGPFMQPLVEKYGEMFTMKFGNSYWLFLNSRRLTTELLEKRAAIYSSRQNLAMAHELASGGQRILVMPYGDLWRRERKVMHSILNSTNQELFAKFQDVESRALCFHYLRQPDLWWQAHARFSNSVIMSVVFGRRTELGDPDLMALLSNAEKFVIFLSPGKSMVDLMPWLLRIPWAKKWQPWRWYGDKLYEATARTYQKQVDDLLERRHLGTQAPCFMTEFFDMGKDKEFTAEESYFMAGTMMEAGSETTRTSLHELAAGAALFPEWVATARKELDEVCGGNAERLPELSDMPNLPYIKAIAKETLRWKPAIAELGIPHSLIKDDEFEGYRLPAGTVVTWNHWAISHLESEYKDPTRFWPERFLNDELDKPTKGHLGFGAGRRLCVGYTVAWNNLLIAIARLVYCFDYQQVLSEPIDVSKPFSGFANSPPFSLIVKPRSEAHVALVLRECETAANIEQKTG